LNRAVQGCLENNCGRIWCAVDGTGKWAAAIFIAWDVKTAYYIIGGKDDAFGNSGAMSLLFWNSFQYLKDKVKRFDFEGSMIKGVEKLFPVIRLFPAHVFRDHLITVPLIQSQEYLEGI
jgi:hypothetical protein